MLSVRPMEGKDIPRIVDYFCRATPEYYERLGIDPKKLPSPAQYTETLTALLDEPAEKARAFYSIWHLGNKAIGHSSLKDIVYGEFGCQHLHLWETLERGKGYGATLFCLSTLDFYQRFKLKKIICEPRANNPLPNKMLQKIGFPSLGSRVATSSEICQLCELNRYDIQKAIAEKFLERMGLAASALRASSQ